MCFGESGLDTLDGAEQESIGRIARQEFPAHDFSILQNDDGITWAVLNPRGLNLPRFTICRIDPCLVVMIERGEEPRVFRSVPDVDAAGAVLRDVSGAAGFHVLH